MAALEEVAANHPGLLGEPLMPNGQHALHVAAIGRSDPAMIRRLVELGASVNAICGDSIQATPLHYSAGAGDVDATRALLDAGADILIPFANEGKETSCYAMAKTTRRQEDPQKRKEICRLLRERGALVGHRVRIHNLLQRAELNKCTAVVTAFDASSGRYAVMLKGDSRKQIKVKPANLKARITSSAAVAHTLVPVAVDPPLWRARAFRKWDKHDTAVSYLLAGAKDLPGHYNPPGYLEWIRRRILKGHHPPNVDVDVAMQVIGDPAIQAFYLEPTARALVDAENEGDPATLSVLLCRASKRTASSLHLMVGLERLPAPLQHDASNAAFDGLSRRCAWCGEPPHVGAKFSSCNRCKLTRYCSPECQRKGWEEGMHKSTCGQPLPTARMVEAATAAQLTPWIKEFGAGHARLYEACCARIVVLHDAEDAASRHGSQIPHMFALSDAGAAGALVRGMQVHPWDSYVQAAGACALYSLASYIGLKDVVSAAGAADAARNAVRDYLKRGSVSVVAFGLNLLMALQANRRASVHAEADRAGSVELAELCLREYPTDEAVKLSADHLLEVAQRPFPSRLDGDTDSENEDEAWSDSEDEDDED